MVGAVIASAGIASGNGPVVTDKGRLDLYTGDSGYTVTWYQPNGVAAPAKQILTIDAKCNVGFSGPNYISITQTGGTTQGGISGIGAVSHGLGIKTKTNCSTEQGQIVEGQKLKISVGNFFGSTVQIAFAEVDIEGKRNAKVEVFYSAGPSETRLLEKNSSDNGPDSGPNDNNIVRLPKAGTRNTSSLEFAPVMGGSNSPAISIEGGGDGQVLVNSFGTNASTFSLVGAFDGELFCDGTTPSVGGSTTMQGIFKRLANLDNATCILKPYNLSVNASGDILTFDPEDAASGDQDAAYSGKISAPPKPSANPTGAKLKYDPELDGSFADMKWCLTATIGTDGYVTTADLPPNAGPSPYDEPWCIAAENTAIVSGSKIRTTWTVYGHDDPFFRGN